MPDLGEHVAGRPAALNCLPADETVGCPEDDKSKKRVADHGEVFTPAWMVDAMLDLVKDETERIDSRFLEPACGSGNFLAQILWRKLATVELKYGKSDFERRHYALLALMCIYGIELLADNIAECRVNVLEILAEYLNLDESDELYRAASYVLLQNLVHGDALTMRTHDGQPITFAEWGYLGRGRFQRRDFRFDTLTHSSAFSAEGSPGYDNEAGRDTLKLYIDALYKHKIHEPKLKRDAEGFANQQAAMFVRESWLVGYMKKNAPNVQYAVAPLPAGKKTNTLLFWTNLYVTSGSKQPREAWDFIMFMANGPKLKELEQILYTTVGWMPPRNDVQKRHANIYAEVPQYKYFAEVPSNSELYPYPRLSVTDKAFTKLAERLVKAYQDKSLLDNPAGIAKLIREAAEETNAILKENKLYCGK